MMLNLLHQAANEGDIESVTKLIIEDKYDINTPNYEVQLFLFDLTFYSTILKHRYILQQGMDMS
jgi:hypothetical protein